MKATVQIKSLDKQIIAYKIATDFIDFALKVTSEGGTPKQLRDQNGIIDAAIELHLRLKGIDTDDDCCPWPSRNVRTQIIDIAVQEARRLLQFGLYPPKHKEN